MSDVLFDREALILEPLAERSHLFDLSQVRPLSPVPVARPTLAVVAEAVRKSRADGGEVLIMMGAHVVRAGVQRYLINLITEGWITAVAMNGASAIHDFEIALVGATTESVARYLPEGRFGLWRETGLMNDIINQAHSDGGTGMGAALGKTIDEKPFPYAGVSLLAACHRNKIPATVHIGIGQDINHMHPNFDPCAAGALSYRDFLTLVSVVSRLEGGVVLSFGSAVMAPEVFQKALSMARNVAHGRGEKIGTFTVLVCDIVDLPEDTDAEPPVTDPRYYFRPWKTLLVRAVAGSGRSAYVKGRHEETIPELWSAVNGEATGPSVED